MEKKNVLKFVCCVCGSNNLGFDEYVLKTTKVEFPADGLTTYVEPKYVDDDSIPEYGGYYCADCGKRLHCYDVIIRTEGNLNKYLSIPLEERIQMQKEWDEELKLAQESTPISNPKRSPIG
jgi:hypothetical protein